MLLYLVNGPQYCVKQAARVQIPFSVKHGYIIQLSSSVQFN